ncbi:DMT family transporter [Martelella soudanensis]|uniref:DMT family transporter n=1 Tax=unclassified Martelella TaxID=2629616 RepID=UPI0015DE9AF4|nr:MULTISPECIES: DMT family transporter [unclassified Martelella]
MSIPSAVRRPSTRLVATFLMLCGVAAFTLVDTFSKSLTARHAPLVVMFMQYGLSALMMLPVALGQGAAGFRIIGPRLLVLRAAIGVVVSFLIVTSLSLLPFTVAAALLQLETLFFIPLAIVLLKERADWRRWFAVGLGLGGAFLILRPGTETFQLAGLVALAGAVALAIKNVVLKQVAMSEATVPALFWMYVLMAGIAAIPAWFAWGGMSLADFGLFLVSAALVNISNYSMLRAFSMADAVQLTPALHTALPIAVLIGIVVFGEWPTPFVWAGIALIFLATFMPSGPEKSG